jgi:hypothetical protein
VSNAPQARLSASSEPPPEIRSPGGEHDDFRRLFDYKNRMISSGTWAGGPYYETASYTLDALERLYESDIRRYMIL